MAGEVFNPIDKAIDSVAFSLPFGIKIPLPSFEIFGYHFQLTKYMVIELVVAVTMLAIFLTLARKICSGQPPKGRFWNMFEVLLLYLRNSVFRPAIGKEYADRYVPYLWTLFFFLLFTHLYGFLPWSGTPTASTGVTFVFAFMTFMIVNISGVMKYGIVGYWLGLVPKMKLSPFLAIFLLPLMFVIELLSLFIKHGVLGIRIWANMFAGSIVYAVFLSFIVAGADFALAWWALAASGGVIITVLLSFLKLLVACLQAYIFTMLTALFIGAALHQH